MSKANEAGSELDIKLARVRSLMERKNYGACLFLSQHNFSWLTCGGSDPVVHGLTEGFPGILVTAEELFLIASNIEMPRLQAEELAAWKTAAAGPRPHGRTNPTFQSVEYPWIGGSAEREVRAIVGDCPMATDLPWTMGSVEPKLGDLRVPLDERETARFGKLAAECAGAFDLLSEKLAPGQSEVEIQSILAAELMTHGIYTPVLLVGTDQRVFRFRHPVPTSRRLERYAMVVVCAERGGLVVSMTRLFHFGPPTREILDKYEALLRVDMAYIKASRPGRSLSEVFEAGRSAYRDTGYAGEEHRHFQGGTCGYRLREHDLEADSEYVLKAGEIFANNPSISGVCIEDTILIEPRGYRVLTLSQNWPSRTMEQDGTTLARPEILIL